MTATEQRKIERLIVRRVTKAREALAEQLENDAEALKFKPSRAVRSRQIRHDKLTDQIAEHEAALTPLRAKREGLRKEIENLVPKGVVKMDYYSDEYVPQERFDVSQAFALASRQGEVRDYLIALRKYQLVDAFFDADATLRDFVEDDLVQAIYLSDGVEAEALLAKMNKKLDEVLSAL